MHFLRQLRTGPRLGLGFGLMVLLMLALSLYNFFGIHQLTTNQQFLETNLHPKVQSSQRLSYLVMDMARLVRNSILLSDEKRLATTRESIAKAQQAVKDELAVIGALITDDKGRALLADMTRSTEAYFAFSADVAELGFHNKDAEATALLFGERYRTQAECLAAMKAMAAFQETRMQVARDEAAAIHRSAVTGAIVATLAAALSAVACAWLITRSVTVPLGDAVKVAEAVAAGDLTSRINVDAKDEAGQLLSALKAMNERLGSIVGQVRQAGDSIATGSREIATGNADLSQRTEEQAANLQQTAASMEQLTSTVKSNADTARQATQLAGSASDAAVRGGAVVNQVVGTMDAISASSRKIADIIGVIDGIAFQTNILALNAAVEAARAGEQGRGFAVVASEVRSLAQRSAAAAKEIKQLINDSVEKVSAGSQQVGDAGRTMGDIVLQVKRVNDLIGEISSATQEQTQGIGQVGDAVNQLDQVTQQNAALVEQSAAAAESLKNQAAQLVDTMSIFTLHR